MTAVGDILELAYGKALKESDRDGGPFPVVGSGGIVGGHSLGITEQPTIVVGRKGSIGTVTWIDGPAWPIDTAYYVKPRRSDLHPRWAYWMLSSLGMETMNKSAAVPGLNRDDVYRLDVDVPAPMKQRRIAAILDHADTLRAKRRQVLALLAAVESSVFRWAVGEGVDAGRLGDLATTTSGGTPNRSIAANFGGGISWVKSGELRGGLIASTEETISGQGLATSSAKIFPAGTVLLAMYGATAGVVGQLGVDAATNQAICAITPGPALNAEFLVAALRAQTAQLVARAAGGAQPNLSQGIVRDLVIPLPTLARQQEFSTQVAALRKQRAKVVLAQGLETDLFSVLQSRAFAGEL